MVPNSIPGIKILVLFSGSSLWCPDWSCSLKANLCFYPDLSRGNLGWWSVIWMRLEYRKTRGRTASWETREKHQGTMVMLLSLQSIWHFCAAMYLAKKAFPNGFRLCRVPAFLIHCIGWRFFTASATLETHCVNRRRWGCFNWSISMYGKVSVTCCVCFLRVSVAWLEEPVLELNDTGAGTLVAHTGA